MFPPPDILEDLFEILHFGKLKKEKSWTGSAKILVNVFSYLSTPGIESDRQAVLELVKYKIDLNLIERFPIGVQVVIREILHRCRESPPTLNVFPKEAYTLIGREDVYLSSNNVVMNDLEEANDIDDDFKLVQTVTRLRFGRDHRIKEAYRLLDSASPQILYCKRRPGMTDHDLIKAQQIKLKQIIGKSLAGTLGRGAMMLFTKRNVLEKNIFVPTLTKSGRIPPQNVNLQLDDSHALKYAWPSFHNGVSAGLARYPRDKVPKDLTRSWILFNKPKNPNDSHAGVILALGLNKDLAVLNMTDIYEHIGPGHDLTSIAMLLGLGCAKAGSCDSNIRKTLTLHVPSLFPQEFSDLDVVSSSVQSAAITGLGLLYRGTCNRLMCEFLLEEISKPPASDSVVDERESYSLSAGLALGMVALGLGGVEGGLSGLADLEIEDRLNLLISGGPTAKLIPHQSESDESIFNPADIFNASSMTRDDRIGNFNSNNLSSTTNALLLSADRDPKCSRVLEGTHVNTDVTSAGATIALGLIYLKSNDLSVASRLSPPQTRFLLENIRPDFLMFRVWAKCLVMWDFIRPEKEWIFEQVPAWLMNYGLNSKNYDVQDMKYFSQAKAYIVAGAALGMGLSFAGTINRVARDCLIQLTQSDLFQNIEEQCADTCFSCVIIALGLIMAGSGDLDTFRVVRTFRKVQKRYGAQQIFSLSLGFLFLGCGRMSFSRSSEAIASLVCSIFPRLASSVDDNSTYLQALRHLYVLACEQRCVECFDSVSGEACYTPLRIQFKAPLPVCELSCGPDLDDLPTNNNVLGNEFKYGDENLNEVIILAPAILPPIETIVSIRVDSPRYWPLSISVNHQTLQFPLKLVVKLRADQLPYAKDPRGLSCLSARPRPRNAKDLSGSLRDFSNKSPFILTFARYLPDSFDILYECLVHDTLEALSTILEIQNEIRNVSDPLQAEQLRFLKRYYGLFKKFHRKNLVNSSLLLFSNRIPSNALMQYLRTGKSGDLEQVQSNHFFVSLNLAGIPKYATFMNFRLSSNEDLKSLSKHLDPDTFVEICDAISI